MTENNTNDKYLLSSVKNALRILQSFSLAEREKTVSALAEELGLGKSTVSRLLTTLSSEGFVTKDPLTHHYRLGLSMLTLGGIVQSNIQISKEAAPILSELTNEVGETSHVAILEGIDAIYINKAECNHPVRILTFLGRKNPAYCTSSGKVLLAFGDQKVVEEIIEGGLKPFTDKTITNPDLLRSTLYEVKKDGYVISKCELLDGVTSMAAPVYDYTGEVVAAINIVGPVQRIKDHQIPLYTKKVIEAAKELSRNLGYLHH